MNIKKSIFLIISVLISSGTLLHLSAQQLSEKVQKVITFSGVISDADNNIVTDGEYKILFSLYTAPEGENSLWSELHEKVTVQNGEINVQLGSQNPLNISFDKAYYLGIKLNNSSEITPRMELVPSPFSVRTLSAATVKDNSISADKIAPFSITNDKIKNVSWDKITDLPEMKAVPVDVPNILPKYWRRYGNWLETGNEFLGTVNDRNLVIKTNSIQRMLFDPYGKVQMGTVTDSVFFEVIGKTTLADVWVKAKMGVGADFNKTESKLHIKSTGTQIPLRIDNNSIETFVIESNGRVVITSQVTGGDDGKENYALFVNSEDQGIAININGDESNSDHNYMTFWDEDGIAGRIEGENAADYLSDPKNIAHDVWLAAQAVALGVAIAASVAGLEVPDIINGVAEIAYFTFQTTWDLTHLGVTYESGSGDYAEWLEKLNPEELFMPGDIVGVSDGKISKNTANAQQIMCISTSPIVLGNMPAEGKEKYFEKTAFMGQIPVKVNGIVHKGDYIIPSGLNDGTAVAVPPELMTLEEFMKVLGRAWEENTDGRLKFINTAVGLKMKDLAVYIRNNYLDDHKLELTLDKKNKELESLLAQINELEKQVEYVIARMNNSAQHDPKYTLNKK